MRVLLDENVPSQLARALTGHEATSVQRMRWSGLKNGALLQRAASNFDALITVDRSVRHQQVLPPGLAMVVLRVTNNRPETVLPLATRILEELGRIQPGEIVEVAARA